MISTQINPKKLLHSKWTARRPINKEKHFLIVRVTFKDSGQIEDCFIEAVISGRTESIDWNELKNPEQWKQGWQ